MKKLVLRISCAVLIVALLFAALPYAVKITVPEYNDAVGNGSDDQKIKGLYLLKESAKRSDNIVIYGSSELRTDYITTHPANFFENKKGGFQINLVGRGSCQSIIHAISIASSGTSLKDTPVVLITSPQSYVEGGITPDMFFANFSKQQYITIMYDNTINDDIKQRLSKRVCEMIKRYDEEIGTLSGYEDIRLLAKIGSDKSFVNTSAKVATAPFFLFEKYMENCRDMVKSADILRANKTNITAKTEDIDWKQAETDAIEVAKKETTNNDFGMRNSDYKKNVKNRLDRFKDKEKNLSYDNSVEYDDLRLLLDICKEKGIEPMFVSVPLHGEWSDYTGFAKERRESYYQKVEAVVSEYDAHFVDLSGYEYEEYFLCDTMHLGWKGWIRVNEEIYDFYHEFNSNRLQ